jgi:pyruvate formate lyase activating enzyme
MDVPAIQARVADGLRFRALAEPFCAVLNYRAIMNRSCTNFGFLTRREFLATAGMAIAGSSLARDASPPGETAAREAGYYEKLDGNAVRCCLCPWQCMVTDGKRGKCRVRENRGGRYYSLVYGYPCTTNNDPIEKKPFFHVYPGSRALSIATVGCNIACKFCQNWDISQARPEDVRPVYLPPRKIVEQALAAKARAVAYTYSEPTIFFEYMLDCARAAKEAGLGNVVVSNGFIAEKPLKDLCSVVTAVKIDFKAFTEKFYADVCGGELQPVLESLKRLAGSGVWFEMVVLVIPTLNDDMDDIKRMSAWIVRELGPNVPLHFTRFHPAYRLNNLPPTPPRTLELARKTAMDAGCRFVYGGNLPGYEGENTYCPQCKTCVLDRYHFTLESNALKDGACPKCGTAIPGVWK